MFEFECTACGSNEASQLGVLGNLVHLRCRSCGMQSSVTVDEFMEGEEDEDDEADGEYENVTPHWDSYREDFHSDG